MECLITLRKLFGLKLAGIDTSVVTTKQKANEIIEKIALDKEVGILVINQAIYQMASELIEKIKKQNFPLVIQL